MTLGAALGVAAKAVITAIGSLSVGEALALGAFAGGVIYTLYIKIKAFRRMHKKSQDDKEKTVTQKIHEDAKRKKCSRTSPIDFDAWDEKIDDIEQRSRRETEEIYRNILDEIDEDVQTRNRGKNHKYGKSSKKRDFAPVKRMKDRDRRRSFGGTLTDDEDDAMMEQFYSEIDEILRSEDRKKFSRFIDEDDGRDMEAIGHAMA